MSDLHITDQDFSAIIAEAAERVTRMRAAEIELALAEALQERAGLLVDDDAGTVQLDPTLPRGQINHKPWRGGPGWVERFIGRPR